LCSIPLANLAPAGSGADRRVSAPQPPKSCQTPVQPAKGSSPVFVSPFSVMVVSALAQMRSVALQPANGGPMQVQPARGSSQYPRRPVCHGGLWRIAPQPSKEFQQWSNAGSALERFFPSIRVALLARAGLWRGCGVLPFSLPEVAERRL
jgi:hypothetical protein